MKLFRLLPQFLLGLVVASCVACTTMPGTTLTPTQQAIAAGVTSYNALDASILAADSAVKANLLKGQDARNALDGATKAKAGLDSMLVALRAANAAASGAAK